MAFVTHYPTNCLNSTERSLEAMRQPLENHIVTISRASETLTFPATFQLIAAMNPCPCGYWGEQVSVRAGEDDRAAPPLEPLHVARPTG